MSHDEIRVANWCKACRDRKLTPGQLLADNVRQCTEILKSVNPRARIVVWSDMFDPHHNAVDSLLPGQRLAEGLVGGAAARRDHRQLERRQGAGRASRSSPAAATASSSRATTTSTTSPTSRPGTRPRGTSRVSSASCTRPGSSKYGLLETYGEALRRLGGPDTIDGPEADFHPWRTPTGGCRIDEENRGKTAAGNAHERVAGGDRFGDRPEGRALGGRAHGTCTPTPSRAARNSRRREYLAQQLDEAGLRVRIAPSGRGLIAEPEGLGDRPRVAIRADIDALRIADAKNVPYRSSRDGVMHACGHDAHATMALGAALALWECPRVVARARSPGGRSSSRPRRSARGRSRWSRRGRSRTSARIVALHVDPELSVGRIAQRSGVLTAACQEVRIAIRGVGGHAARPHLAVDPIAVAAQLVTSLYQFVPRSVDSRDPSVVTFGSIRGGTGPNIIPDEVELLGTIRTLSDRAAAQVEERITPDRARARGGQPVHDRRHLPPRDRRRSSTTRR